MRGCTVQVYVMIWPNLREQIDHGKFLISLILEVSYTGRPLKSTAN